MSDKTRGRSTKDPPKGSKRRKRPKLKLKFRKKLKYFCILAGNTLNSHQDFLEQLPFKKTKLKETSSEEECDAVLVFCPVVSRAGTDISAALQKLDNPELKDNIESKPVVLVVLHHTFELITVPDSSRSVNKENVLSVDCLFHEDRGLLQCQKNQEALKKAKHWMKYQREKKEGGKDKKKKSKRNKKGKN